MYFGESDIYGRITFIIKLMSFWLINQKISTTNININIDINFIGTFDMYI